MRTKKINYPNAFAAFYFSVCTLGFNLIVKYFLMMNNLSHFLPFLSSCSLALSLGAFFGERFSKPIANANNLIYAFMWGALLGMLILLFFSLGLQVIYYFHNPSFYQNVHHWQAYLVLYGVLLSSVFFIVGIWFILFMGLVALFFKRNFDAANQQ